MLQWRGVAVALMPAIVLYVVLSIEQGEWPAAASGGGSFGAYVASSGAPPLKPPRTAVAPLVSKVFVHDRDAFTQGLLVHEGTLYEGTGLWGHSNVREVELRTGKVLRQHDIEKRLFGEGISIMPGGKELVEITWKAQVGIVYSAADFKELRRFKYETKTGEGWGITFGGRELVVSDGSEWLFFWDPATMRETRRVRVMDRSRGGKRGRPVTKLNELEYVKGEVLANIWYSDDIVRIDPRTGSVLGYLDCSGLLLKAQRYGGEDCLNGIAWDEKRDVLLLTGKKYGKLWELPMPAEIGKQN